MAVEAENGRRTADWAECAKMKGATLLILEDNDERIRAMQECVENALDNATAIVFSEVPALIAWCEANLDRVCLISLDHDLELMPQPDGTLKDPGDGRQVAEWLATRRPCCPVILHTSNAVGAESMKYTLLDGGWVVHRVYPTPDIGWVAASWLPVVQRALAEYRLS